MANVRVDLPTLEAVTSKLRTGNTQLEAGADSSAPAPNVGELTEVTTDVIALLVDSVAGVAEGVAIVADRVAAGKEGYVTTDTDQAHLFQLNPPR